MTDRDNITSAIDRELRDAETQRLAGQRDRTKEHLSNALYLHGVLRRLEAVEIEERLREANRATWAARNGGAVERALEKLAWARVMQAGRG
jgi:hypothetical protein